MPKTDIITQARLKELLHYDPETGLFVWIAKSSPYSCIKIGDIAGSVSEGYIVIKIDGVGYKAHRLIFLYMVGWMPVEVDHDDHVPGNNRWENLSPATHTKNMRNHTLHCNNTSGHCGIARHKPTGKWQAQIRVNGKVIYLGLFTELSDAIAARKAADIKYNFHVNHGKAA